MELVLESRFTIHERPSSSSQRAIGKITQMITISWRAKSQNKAIYLDRKNNALRPIDSRQARTLEGRRREGESVGSDFFQFF